MGLRVMKTIALFFTYLAFALTGAAQGVRFAVFSDPHYFSPALAGEGSAFDAAIASDRKMLREGPAILDSTISALIAARPAFVLVPGDLTKDGERISHEEFATQLNRLPQAGIPAFVVPGNHDILNPRAFAYDGTNAMPVETIGPTAFAEIFFSFGYGNAVALDTNSLSYLAYPAPGIALLALDSCIYTDNLTRASSVTGGRLSRATLEWAVTQIRLARMSGRLVMAFMHHGMIPHTPLQESLFRDYWIENGVQAASMLRAAGLSVIFTGHFHAQEIVGRSFNGRTLHDIKTASLVTYPCAVRLCRIDLRTGALDVESPRVQQINFPTGGLPFTDYARSELIRAVHELGAFYLAEFGLTIPPALESVLLEIAAQAAVAHFDGDERMPTAVRKLTNDLLASASPLVRALGSMIAGIYLDLPPADNTARIMLR